MSESEEEPQPEAFEKRSDLKDLNFKVDPDFHRKFKSIASVRGLKMKELLEECFQAYLEKKPL